jgi:hypothetical protein
MPRRCLLGNPLGHKDKKEGQGISTHSLALPFPTRGNVAYQQADVCATGHLVSLSTKPTRYKGYTYLRGVAANLISFKGGIIRSKDVQLGMLVRVSELHRKLDYRGQTGVVHQRYGNANYAAFDIQFLDGRSELFWHHEFDEEQGFH